MKTRGRPSAEKRPSMVTPFGYARSKFFGTAGQSLLCLRCMRTATAALSPSLGVRGPILFLLSAHCVCLYVMCSLRSVVA